MFSLSFSLKSLCELWTPRKLGHGQQNVMIYSKYDGPDSIMLHTKIGEIGPSGPEKKFFFFFFFFFSVPEKKFFFFFFFFFSLFFFFFLMFCTI